MVLFPQTHFPILIFLMMLLLQNQIIWITTFYCYSARNSITNLENVQLFFTEFKREYQPTVHSTLTLIQSSNL